jgi:oligoendopeptidase F
MGSGPKILKRKDAPIETTWNSESVFESWDTWQVELEDLLSQLSRFKEFEGKLNSASVVADWFELYYPFARRIAKLGTYTRMSAVVDTSDALAKGYLGQVSGLAAQFSAAAAFSEPEIQSHGMALLDWVRDEPRLADYEHHFRNLLRQKAHRRSAEVEGVLGLLNEPFGAVPQVSSELTNTDLKFAESLDSQGNNHHVGQTTVPPSGIQDADRDRRRTAWESFSDGYLSVQNTLAANYSASVKQNIFNIRVRGYESVLHAVLSPTNIPVEVFHNLIRTFKSNLPTWHRYWDVKRRILGVDHIHPYDIWAPITFDQPEVSYQTAVDWISNGMSPLGEEYVDILRTGCWEERWVDYAPNVGKRQGAASSRCNDTHPFIYMSFDDTVMGMSVLAHELGHSMHAYYADRHQPDVYSGAYGMSVAETASNFNQALTRAYLLETRSDDKQFQIALIDEALFNFHRYFFIMPTLARFELEVYTRAEEGKPLTAELFNGVMSDLFAEGYGQTMSDDTERTGITWAQFLHLYVPYYTFQYAIGISAAHALSEGVLSGAPEASENYLSFLSAGGSKYTMELFQLAGVDMSSPDPVERTFDVLAGLVDKLEQLTLTE